MNSSTTMSPATTIEELPIGCRIENIRRGKGEYRSTIIYADLVGPDGTLLIAADIGYITDKLNRSSFIPNEQFIAKYR